MLYNDVLKISLFFYVHTIEVLYHLYKSNIPRQLILTNCNFTYEKVLLVVKIMQKRHMTRVMT